MDELNVRIKSQASCVLEAVEYAISNAESQTNKVSLLRIKEITTAIGTGSYDNIHELRGIIINNIPKEANSNNNIFMMDVQGCGLELPLQMFLDELMIMVEGSPQ